MQLDRDGAIGGRIKGPIREGIMLATGSQLARRSLGILRQQLEHHVQLIEHARIRHHWVLGFLKTRNSKLDTGHISPFIGLKTCSHRFSDYGFSACRIHGRSGPRPLRARRQADVFCRSERHCLARFSAVTAGVRSKARLVRPHERFEQCFWG
jgi:hypothetical protein